MSLAHAAPPVESGLRCLSQGFLLSNQAVPHLDGLVGQISPELLKSGQGICGHGADGRIFAQRQFELARVVSDMLRPQGPGHLLDLHPAGRGA